MRLTVSRSRVVGSGRDVPGLGSPLQDADADGAHGGCSGEQADQHDDAEVVPEADDAPVVPARGQCGYLRV